MQKYKKIRVVSEFGDNGGLIYEAIKQDKKYFVYEFDQYGEAEAYNFKVLKKIISSHVLAVCQQFQQNDTKYIVTDYADKDLLQLQTGQPNRVFPLPVALDYFSKIVLALEQMHDNKLVYRNVRPEVIKLREENVFLYDFTLSQFCKRKQRIFDVVGCQSFLAPQFFSEDGYSFEIDIWAAGVLLFYMLTNDYPFKFKNKTQKCSQEELKTIAEGFSLQKKLEQCKNPGFIKSNKVLQDFFSKIFEYDYTKRITIKQIKNHKLMVGFFPEKLDNDILQAIGEEESTINSLLMTTFFDLKKFKVSQKIQKQQIIVEFIERCSESLMLDCSNYISEKLIAKGQFALLKVAMIKINNLIAICYGKKKPDFQYEEEDFEIARTNSAFKKVVQGIEKKQKILAMFYKSAYVSLGQKNSEDPFYSEQIPDDFNQIKISYRVTLAQIFEVIKSTINKNKENKPLTRKLAEMMVRMVIMHLINRIFEPEDYDKNFNYYIEWNKDPNIANLDAWIHNEKNSVLKKFVKDITKNYL